MSEGGMEEEAQHSGMRGYNFASKGSRIEVGEVLRGKNMIWNEEGLTLAVAGSRIKKGEHIGMGGTSKRALKLQPGGWDCNGPISTAETKKAMKRGM